MGSPVGAATGPSSYGHTGFTGTSLWVEPGADGAPGRYYVVLTNRVHPSREPRRFPAVRRAFHHHAAALARRADTLRTPAPATGSGSASMPVGREEVLPAGQMLKVGRGDIRGVAFRDDPSVLRNR